MRKAVIIVLPMGTKTQEEARQSTGTQVYNDRSSGSIGTAEGIMQWTYAGISSWRNGRFTETLCLAGGIAKVGGKIVGRENYEPEHSDHENRAEPSFNMISHKPVKLLMLLLLNRTYERRSARLEGSSLSFPSIPD
jgi:hypothetical protein